MTFKETQDSSWFCQRLAIYDSCVSCSTSPDPAFFTYKMKLLFGL